MNRTIDLTLKVWRQANHKSSGKLQTYHVKGINTDMSFLEMIDVLNEDLISKGENPVAFDHDCREGICGMCSMMINGQAHGPELETTTCQLHMRHFKNGETIVIEPWQAKAFPIIKDLVVDRRAFDRIIQAGGYNSVNVGNAPDGNSQLIPKQNADRAMDAAACLGCGACVAACKNASASLFVAAKISHLVDLPQGQPERRERALNMVAQMDEEGFGGCTNTYECQAACPAGIKVTNIATMNREYLKASLCSEE